jgi:S-DNA-T family DNA segregation ATPase FtsK/SpoIIIE
MRIKLRAAYPDGRACDIEVVADASATVEDVAERLARVNPELTPGGVAEGPLTLAVRTDGDPLATGFPLAPGALFGEAGLRSGMAVRLSPQRTESDPVTRVVVRSHRNGQETYDLRPGTFVVGRDPLLANIVLEDPLVSRRHLQISVAEQVTVADLGAANPTLVNGVLEDWVQVADGDTVTAGDTELTFHRLRPAPVGIRAGDHAERFNRSPAVRPDSPGVTVTLPAPPVPKEAERLQWALMVAPLLMGGVVFAFTRSPLSLVFVACSPLIAVWNILDKRIRGRRSNAKARREFDASLTAAGEDIQRALAKEHAAAWVADPPLPHLLQQAKQRGPLLWRRRPDRAGFLVLPVGAGPTPAALRVKLPPRGESTSDDWDRLEQLAAGARVVQEAPVAVDLTQAGSVGCAGPDHLATPAARALLAHLALAHSPTEVVVIAALAPARAEEWDWIKWLPHVGSAFSPIPGPQLVSAADDCVQLAVRLGDLVATRQEESKSGASGAMPRVVVLVDDLVPAARAKLVAIAESGPQVGVHFLWLAESLNRIPAACHGYVELFHGGIARLGLVRTDRLVEPIQCHTLDLAAAHELAIGLAPLLDAGALALDESDLPRRVSFPDLVGHKLVTDPSEVFSTWRTRGTLKRTFNQPEGASGPWPAPLSGTVGLAAGGDLTLDLRAHGPHALVGGTTGSGKSEFLQTWVTSMALNNSPDRVVFLFVDYKGGAAFADCVNLPHCVGLVTDLAPHLVRRALSSLRAELRRREEILNLKQESDLLSLERTGDPDCPPALVIIVDEFAALVAEMPEFVDGMVDVAQRGRSLGVHVVLATQRPTGVIKENIRANTNLRIALRVADDQDSLDVVGDVLAAKFDPAVPGRAVARFGPGRAEVFQAGYLGGRSAGARVVPQVDVSTLGFGPGQPWSEPVSARAQERAQDLADEGPTDAALAVSAMRRAADLARVQEPRRPWLPELEETCDLEYLWTLHGYDAAAGRTADVGWILGLLDEPERQAQSPLFYRPDEDGNLAVYGTGGSGESTVLRTLVAAASMSMPADPVEFYGIDCGGGALGMITELPNVGAVVDGADEEMVKRLVGRLLAETESRNELFGSARASSIREYRESAGGNPRLRRLTLLIDGFGAFRERWEGAGGPEDLVAQVGKLLQQGRAVGVSVVMACERPDALNTALGSAIGRRLVLRQADKNHYGALGIADDILGLDSPAGRGVMVGSSNELQVAVASGSQATADQADVFVRWGKHMRMVGVPAAPGLQALSASIPAAIMPPEVGGNPVLGVESDSLQTVGFEPKGPLAVLGMAGSGRSNAVAWLVRSLLAWRPSVELFYLGPKRSPLAAKDCWAASASEPEAATVLVEEVAKRFARDAGEDHRVALVVEGWCEWADGTLGAKLGELVKRARSLGHLVIGEDETPALAGAWGAAAELKAARRGFILQPDTVDGETAFKTTFPKMKRTDYPPGRGIWVDRGRLSVVQLPLAEGEVSGETSEVAQEAAASSASEWTDSREAESAAFWGAPALESVAAWDADGEEDPLDEIGDRSGSIPEPEPDDEFAYTDDGEEDSDLPQDPLAGRQEELPGPLPPSFPPAGSTMRVLSPRHAAAEVYRQSLALGKNVNWREILAAYGLPEDTPVPTEGAVPVLDFGLGYTDPSNMPGTAFADSRAYEEEAEHDGEEPCEWQT